MFSKDTLRLIKRTYKRFLSLFLIVTIGVAFMVGVMASSPVLRDSVDVYDDQNNLMDIQLYSSYGFAKEDVAAIKDTRGVEAVFPSKFVDVYGQDAKGDLYVTRVQELDGDVNKFELVEGRLPENPNEALTLSAGSFGSFYQIGEQVKLNLDDENALRERLKYQEYTIVGAIKTPQYMALTNETSTLDNLELDTVLFVDNDNFKSEYYTTLYLSIEGAKELTAFSDEYNEYIDKATLNVERTKKAQGNFLKDKIIKEAEAEIVKGEKELEEQVSEATAELDANQKKLDDAYIEIIVGETEIKNNESQMTAGQKTIDANKAILDANAKTVNEGIAQVEKTSGMSFDLTYQQITATHQLYQVLKLQQSNTPDSIKKIEEQIASNELKIVALAEQKTLAETKLSAELAKPESEQDPNLISELETEIANYQTEMDGLEETNRLLKIAISELEGQNIQELLDKMDEQAGGSVEKTYADMTKLKDAKASIDSGYAQLDAAIKELESGKKQLEEAKAKLVSGRAEYENGVKELEKARYEFNQEVEKAKNDLAKARQDLSELPDAEWTILDRSMHYSSYMFENTINQMHSIGLIFPLLFFLVAALVCMTTMTRLIDEERSQLGIFSALGFSKAKIISKYLLYALLASISGSILGLVIGMALFPTVIYEAWRLMYNLPPINLHLPLDIALLGVSSFTLLMLLVTFLVAKRSLKEVPAQLMRPKAPKNAKKVFLENITPLWRLLSFTSKITARNLIRYKSRFFMTVIGVAGCTGLLVAGFGIKDSISDIINIQFNDVFSYNHTINLEDDQYLEETLDALNADSNNEQSVPFLNYSSKVYFEDQDEKTITVQVFDDRQIDRVMNLRTLKGQTPLDIHGDGVIISEKFAKVNNLNVGDEITIESENGIKATVLIDGICELYFQHYLFISSDLYQEAFNETLHYNSIAVKALDSGVLIDDLADIEGIKSIVDFTPMIANFQNMIEALDFIILVIIISSGSLAFVVLMNLSEVNISERLREIATIKVLGFNDGEVNSYIFKEILLLTLIGALVGLPLGKIEHNLIMTVIDMDMVMFGMNVGIMSYIYAFAITLIFTALVLIFMSRTLKKVKMVESLKSVE